MQSIKQAPITTGTRVFVASDLDVPLDNKEIRDAFRLDCMTPTLKYIIEKGGIPTIGGHIGRPNGKVIAELSTEQLRPYFDEHLGAGKYELLENLRFYPEEEDGNEDFALNLAKKVDLYVNEAFSTSHRKHASITGIPRFVSAYAGLRLEQEVITLKKLLEAPQHPFVVLIGGAKLEDKKPVATKFLEIADHVLLGGKIGLAWMEEIHSQMRIPNDYADKQMDIGKETIKDYTAILSTAKTILWAGPMGRFEIPEFMQGSEAIARAIVEATEKGAYSVVGGGDSIDVLKTLDLLDKMSFISTGGGAMLEFLAYGTLPGIEALG